MQDNNTIKSEIGQVLSDKRTGGKHKGEEQPWAEHKIDSLLLSESYKRLGKKSVFERVENCGEYLEFKRFPDNSLKLNQAYFCKNRLCPMCAWRRSLKIFGQMSKVLNQAEKEHGLRYIFLTLTIKNVEAEELSPTIDELINGFTKLGRRKAFKQAVVGWLRVLEVNYNQESGEYHPHFHVILAVKPDYFLKTNADYIEHSEWVEMWKKSMKLDYLPSVRIESVRKNKKANAAAEVAKYTVKSKDYLIKNKNGEVIENEADWIVNVLDSSLKNRRLVAMGGILKAIHKSLNLDDMEDGNLVDTDNEEINEDLAYQLERYAWNVGFSYYTLRRIKNEGE